MSGAAMFTASQTAYRFYEDGTESGSVAITAANNTKIVRGADYQPQLLLRIRVQESGGAAGATTDDWQLQYNKNAAGWNNVTTSSSNVKAFASSNLTDAGTTTNRLGSGTGSFVAGEISEDGLVDDRQLTASNYTEMLYTIELVPADLANGDVVQFRLLYNGATFTYSVTPELSVSKVPSGTPVTITNHNNTTVTSLGSGVYRVEKTGGSAGTRDAGAVSSASVAGDFTLRLKFVAVGGTPGTFQHGGGVNADPTTDDSHGSIDRLWFYHTSVAFYIYEAGVEITSFSVASDPEVYAWIWRSGSTLGYGRGKTLAVAQASPDRTVTDTNTLGFDSVFWNVGDKLEAILVEPVAVQIAADSGSYTLSGTSAGLAKGRIIAASVGSYALTGAAANLRWAHVNAAASGSYSLSGTAVAFFKGRTITASVGSYAVSGTAVALKWNHRIVATPGSYALTGTAAALKAGRRIAAAAGSYSLTGTAANLRAGRRIAASVGSYSVTGTSTALLWGHSTAATVGSYSLSGMAASLAAGRLIVAASASYAYTGTAATLTWAHVGQNFTITVETGAYSITGYAVTLTFGNPQIHSLAAYPESMLGSESEAAGIWANVPPPPGLS